MEKEAQPESMATVNMKPEYAASEVYSHSSEPPPAYHKGQSSAVKVARIVAVTVVAVSFILGGFLLASAYVTANASCRQLEQELELLTEAADRFNQAPLQPEALVQDAPMTHNHLDSDKSEHPKRTQEVEGNAIDSPDSDSESSSSNESDDEEKETPIHFKLPLQLDFDDLAGALIEKNQKSRMNCVVEKKRAEEVVDHQPKTLRLPFGLNLTTDPRYERLSGERMAIFCESGSFQRHAPEQQHEDDDSSDDDEEEQTIMIQPVMVPIPQSHYPTHMAHQVPQQMTHQMPQQMTQHIPQQMAHHMMAQPQVQIQYQHIHPMETMRPPMPPQQQQPQQQQQQSSFPPSQVLHQIAQQIITQKIMEAQRAREEAHQQLQQQQQESVQQEEEQRPVSPRFHIPEGMVAQRIPIPEEVLTQLNRLPNRDVVIAVSQQDPEAVSQEEQSRDEQDMVQRVLPEQMQVVQQAMRIIPQELRVVQQQRQNAQEMNGRQTYARGLPVNIPVHMIHQEPQEQQEMQQEPQESHEVQEPQAAPSEEARPHYVQPRSVRSVDALLPKTTKRVKRCSCDCAC